jgi:hypothetical protein
MLQPQAPLHSQFPASQAKSQRQLGISACREPLTYSIRELEAKAVLSQFLPGDSTDTKAGAIKKVRWL